MMEQTESKKPKTLCQVCEKEESVGVCSVPSIPMSVAYCDKCLQANAHPWWLLVSNTACIGGLQNAAEFWKDMVKDTCARLGKTEEEFDKEVEEAMNKLSEYVGRNQQ